MGIRGRLRAMAAIPMLLGLTGCTIRGSLSTNAADSMTVDVTFSDFGAANADLCDESVFFGSGLQFVSAEDGSGPTCRVTGTVDPKRLENSGIRVRGLGEYLVLEMLENLEGYDQYPSINLLLDFPGQIIDHDAAEQVAPNQLRLTNLEQLGGDGVRVVALNHPGPPWWVAGTVGGVLAGSLLTLAAVFGIRRRSRSRAVPEAQTQQILAAPEPEPAEAGDPEPLEGGAALGEAAAANDLAAPAVGLPPTNSMMDPAEFRRPAEPVDHSIWAPPRDP